MTIMFGIGNKFGGARRSAPVEISQAESTTTLQGAQMAAGRANKAHDVKTAELAEARSRITELDQVIGARVADDLDASAEVLARQSAQSLVTQLENAVAVLLQRKQDAESAIADAKREAEIEADEAVLAAFMAAVLKLETLLCGEMKRVAEEVGATHKAVVDRCEGDSGTMHQLARFQGYYPTYLIHANAALIHEGRRYIQDIDRDGITLSMQAEKIREMMTRRLR